MVIIRVLTLGLWEYSGMKIKIKIEAQCLAHRRSQSMFALHIFVIPAITIVTILSWEPVWAGTEAKAVGILFIYLLAALGLCCCVQAFSSCSKWTVWATYSSMRCKGFSLKWLFDVTLSHAVRGHPRWTGLGGEVWLNVVHWRREWQTTSVFLPWEPHEQNEKAKMIDNQRGTPQVGRCPICYWRLVEK